jgi:hypothetical protein
MRLDISEGRSGFPNSRLVVTLAMVALGVLTARSPFNALYVLPTILCCLAATMRSNSAAFELADMYWLLVLLFFVIGPLQSLSPEGYVMLLGWRGLAYTPEQQIVAFAVMNAGVVVSYLLFPALPKERKVPAELELGPLFLTSVIVAAFVGNVVFSGGLGNMLSPRFDKDFQQLSIFVNACQGVQCAATFWLFAQTRNLQNAVGRMLSLIALLLLLVSFNPFNVPRFLLIVAWMPIVLMLWPRVRNFVFFYAAAIFSFLVVMPVLAVTTRHGLDRDQLARAPVGQLAELPYVDVFDTLLHAVHVGGVEGLHFGQKLLSVLLFFVPRQIWPEKPVVSGLQIGGDLFNAGLVGTPNLSMNLIGDLFLDFGPVGVLVGSVVFWVLARPVLSRSVSVGGARLQELLLLASMPILMRGSVGAVAAVPVVAFFTLELFRMMADEPAPPQDRPRHQNPF